MRINEILTESQLQQLDEGPIGSALGAVGRGVGKAVGGVAKGVGAVAGGAVGAFNALKKGFQTGKAVVGDDPDPNAGAPGYTAPVEPAARTANTAAAPAAGGAPAGGTMAPAGGAEAPASSTTPPTAQEINAQGPAGTAPAKSQTGAAGQALAKSTAVVDKQQAQSQEKANQTVYAQVKANVDKLDKKGKQRILQLLQKSVAAPAPAAAPAGGAAAAAPAADPAAAGAGAMGQMAKQLAGEKPNTMANAPVSKTNVAKPGNPNAAAPAVDPAAAPAATKAKGGKVAGQVSQTPGAIAKREKRQAAASAKSAGAGAFNQMANRLPQQNASKDNYGNALSEALAHRVEFHKQKMFETGLSRGSISVFRK
jgi:hypothetical protein